LPTGRFFAADFGAGFVGTTVVATAGAGGAGEAAPVAGAGAATGGVEPPGKPGIAAGPALAGAADMIVANAKHGNAGVKPLALQAPCGDHAIECAERRQQ